MTVVAYKSGILACDSLWTDGNLKTTYLTKIERFPNGILYGCSGDNDDRTLKRYLRALPANKVITVDDMPSHEKLIEIQQDLTAMIVVPSTKDIFIIMTCRSPAESDEGVGVFLITKDYYAIGCGGEMAIGAMAAGKTAVEAVQIACSWNISCQEPIHVLELAS